MQRLFSLFTKKRTCSRTRVRACMGWYCTPSMILYQMMRREKRWLHLREKKAYDAKKNYNWSRNVCEKCHKANIHVIFFLEHLKIRHLYTIASNKLNKIPPSKCWCFYLIQMVWKKLNNRISSDDRNIQIVTGWGWVVSCVCLFICLFIRTNMLFCFFGNRESGRWFVEQQDVNVLLMLNQHHVYPRICFNRLVCGSNIEIQFQWLDYDNDDGVLH